MKTIREVAEQHGMTLRTLRFWEQNGLLNPVRKGRDRFYDDAQLEEIGFILRHKALGVGIDDIRSIQQGRLTVNELLPELVEKAEDDLADAQARLENLAAWRP